MDPFMGIYAAQALVSSNQGEEGRYGWDFVIWKRTIGTLMFREGNMIMSGIIIYIYIYIIQPLFKI